MEARRPTSIALALTAAAVIALSAMAASSASAAEFAPRWKVGGAFLGNGVSKKFESQSLTEVLFRAPGITGFNVKSSTCKLSSGKIVGNGAFKAGLFKEGRVFCGLLTVEGMPSCSVTETSQKIAGTLVWLASLGTQAGLKLVAEAGPTEELMRFTITGCGIAGEYPMHGELIAKLLPVETEVTEGEFQLPKLPNTECTPANALTGWWNNKSPREAQSLGTGLAVETSPAAFCGNFRMWIESMTATFGVFPG